MRILGVDPGSIKMGYACIDVAPGCRLTYVEAGVLTAPAKLDKYARLVVLGRDLEAVIAELRPDVCGMEAGFVRNQMGALTSGAARGVAGFIIARAGMQITEYAPATVKKSACGNGAAEKDQVARVIALRLGLARISDPDAADALAVAVTRAADLAAGWVERQRSVA